MKRLFFITAAFLLLGAGCTGTVTVLEGGSPARKLKPSSYFVSYTDEGEFEPNTYRIPVGETLNFVNESEASMRPVSDGLFDGGRDLGMNELFQFTFNKVGTYRYRNASNPDSTGTVVVVNE